MIEQLLLNGDIVKIYSSKEWFDMFTEHCNKIYEERGSMTGEYCCGYHWCCNECKGELCYGCADCVATIISILEENGVEIDYSNLDFDYWERKARDLCQ